MVSADATPSMQPARAGVKRFVVRSSWPRRVSSPLAMPLPHEPIPTVEQLRQMVEHRIDHALPALDDGHAHFLDEWLRTQEADAHAGLEELITHRDQVDAALITRARDRWEKAEHRYRRRAERADEIEGRARELRGEFPMPAPPAPAPGKGTRPPQASADFALPSEDLGTARG